MPWDIISRQRTVCVLSLIDRPHIKDVHEPHVEQGAEQLEGGAAETQSKAACWEVSSCSKMNMTLPAKMTPYIYGRSQTMTAISVQQQQVVVVQQVVPVDGADLD
jgi:hypothetical protein